MPSRILSSSAVGTRGWDKMVERRGTGLPSYDGPGKVYSTSCKSIIVSSFIFDITLYYTGEKTYKQHQDNQSSASASFSLH